MQKIMITGVNGFVGHHLAQELNNRKIPVIGVGREEKATTELEGLLSEYHNCDLIDKQSVEKLPLENISAIINLAGLANVGESFSNPELYKKVNVGVLETICTVVKVRGLNLRILAVSTGAVYDPKNTPPFSESSNLVDPIKTSPYVVSKLEMERVAKNYSDADVNCIVIRPFNHLGPGQLSGFLLPDLAKGIVESISSGKPMLVGNLETKRDFTDVRDVVRAYCDIASSDNLEFDIYNVASGVSISGQQILDLLARELAPSKSLETKLDKKRMRPNDPLDIFGDFNRLKQDTGWQPKIPIDRTIKDFVDWYQKQS